MGNATGSEPARSWWILNAPLLIALGLVLALAAVTIGSWGRVELWTQIVLLALTAIAVVSVLATTIGLVRRGRRFDRFERRKARPEEGSPRLFLYAAVGLAVISAVFVGAILLLNVADIEAPELILPMLLIGGTVAMLLTIAIVAVVFSRFKLTDPSYALALPEGSVRAVIALLLILIFAVMAVFLYATLLKGSQRTSQRITQAQVDVLPREQIVSIRAAGENENGESLFNVELSVPASPAAQDFATQLLTAVGTLVAAISAFYFGARTAAAGAATEAPALRLLSPKSPAKLPGPGEKLEISLEVKPKGAAVQGEALQGGPDPRKVKPDDSTKWEWTAPEPPEPTVILFSLVEYPDVVQRLEISPEEGIPEEEISGVGALEEEDEDLDLEEEEEEKLPPDESPDATTEAGMTETGVEPDEDVEFEVGEGEEGP